MVKRTSRFRLDEALNAPLDIADTFTREHVEAIRAAARRERGRFVPCPTCDGSGEKSCKCRGEFHACAPPFGGPCPDCRGGVQLDPDMIERAVDAVPDWIKPVVDENISGELALDSLVALILWAALDGSDE